MHLRSTSDDYRSSPNKTAIKIQKLPSRFKQPQWHLQFIIQVMDHELQSGSFSSSDDQGQKIPGPTAAMISKYNREYSTMVKQIDRFLETAISSVQKFVTFHNFGVDFNLPLLLNSLNFASSNFRLHLNAMSQLDQKEAKKTAKNKYEVSFNNLVLRMGSLLKDIVDCQVEFKKSYFANQTSPQNSKQRAPTNRSASRLNRSASLTESSTSQNKKFSQLIKNEANQQQKEPQLRSTLNQKLKPKALSFQPECKTQYSTTQNLYRLNEKLGVMLNDMKAMRGRQQKLIELFNLNRVKKLQMIEEQPSALNTSTISSIAPINEYQEEMDQILEDWRGRQSAASEAEDIYSRRGFLKKRTIF